MGKAFFAFFLVLSTASFSLVPSIAHAKASKSKKSSANYQGPLRLFLYDLDGVIIGFNSGETFPVFLWNEASSPFHDVKSSGLPQTVQVPKNDWENGVKSDIPQYDMMPIKELVGHYADLQKGIHNPGNSYYDQPIKLSNGQLLNPRMYYQDANLTHQAFRTNLEANHTPLLDAVQKMIKNKDFGPAFDLLALTTRGDLPVHSMLLTYRGHEEYEWDRFKKQLIKGGYFESDAEIERIYALSNPKLTLNDPTSASQFARADTPLARKKVIVLEYVIDHVLSRRIDRENPENPRPNVLVYAEDNPRIAEMVRDLFKKKIMGVRDRDNDGNVYQPPMRLILLNLAPEWYYEEMPNMLKANPRALANKDMDLDRVMLFDSNARYQRGTPLIQRFNPKSIKDTLAKVVSLAFDVSETTAKKVLSGKTECSVLLANSKGDNK